ncbi:hypothetical protein [Bacillus chungangensis]|uniref:Uncharacterized protein n=1 Tax=Bacillus chungangensis TaxID=587633 RepID=A0ABT9WTU5_9BACI|nr:hypothetical protein [Bacillus chungangensis]MDQ0176724.1 hypothetical protein [Bacillus chungangensis]
MSFHITYKNDISKAINGIKEEMEERLKKASIHFVKETQKKLSREHSGSKTQRATAGEATAAQFEALKSSMQYQINDDEEQLISAIGTDSEIAPSVEYGTSSMAARPFFHPVKEEQLQTIKDLLAGKKT